VIDTGMETRAGKWQGYARVRVRVHKVVPVDLPVPSATGCRVSVHNLSHLVTCPFSINSQTDTSPNKQERSFSRVSATVNKITTPATREGVPKVAYKVRRKVFYCYVIY